MSIDRHQLDELRRQKRPALCILWQVGDVSYYVGILVVAMLFPLLIIVQITLGRIPPWPALLFAVGCVPVGFGIGWLAGKLKDFALRVGKIGNNTIGGRTSSRDADAKK